MRNFVTMLFLLFTPMLFSQETRWNVKSFSADTGIATVEYNGTTYAGVCSYTSILSSPDYEVPPGGESQINDDGGFKSKTTHYSNNCQLDNGLLGRYKSCSTNAKHQDDAACVAHGENPKEWFAFHFSYKPKFDKPCLYTILVVFNVQEPQGIK